MIHAKLGCHGCHYTCLSITSHMKLPPSDAVETTCCAQCSTCRTRRLPVQGSANRSRSGAASEEVFTGCTRIKNRLSAWRRAGAASRNDVVRQVLRAQEKPLSRFAAATERRWQELRSGAASVDANRKRQIRVAVVRPIRTALTAGSSGNLTWNPFL